MTREAIERKSFFEIYLVHTLGGLNRRRVSSLFKNQDRERSFILKPIAVAKINTLLM